MNICATNSTFMFWTLISYDFSVSWLHPVVSNLVDLKTLVEYHDGLIQLLLFVASALMWYSQLPSFDVLLTTFVMMRDSSNVCWCSCGLSYDMLAHPTVIYLMRRDRPWHAICYDTRPPVPEQSEISSSSRTCLLYTSPSPRDRTRSRMPSSA